MQGVDAVIEVNRYVDVEKNQKARQIERAKDDVIEFSHHAEYLHTLNQVRRSVCSATVETGYRIGNVSRRMFFVAANAVARQVGAAINFFAK